MPDSWWFQNSLRNGGSVALHCVTSYCAGVSVRLSSESVGFLSIMALEAETILESGSFSGAVLTMGAVFIASVYQWPSFDVKGFEVLTHKASIAAYRAPTAPQTFFAVDSHMTERQVQKWLTPEGELEIRRNQVLPDKVKPEDVAPLALFLASDDARACSAQEYIVDAGWL